MCRCVFLCAFLLKDSSFLFSGKRYKWRLASSLRVFSFRWVFAILRKSRNRACYSDSPLFAVYFNVAIDSPPLIVLIFGKVVWVHQRERHYFEFGARIEFEWISRLSTVEENSCCGVGYCVIERSIWPRYIHIYIYTRKRLKSYNMRGGWGKINAGRDRQKFAPARAMHKTSLITFCKINYRFRSALLLPLSSLSLPSRERERDRLWI